jgi:CRP/FNR family transcriptional regulator, anaerobic regulatory protein
MQPYHHTLCDTCHASCVIKDAACSSSMEHAGKTYKFSRGQRIINEGMPSRHVGFVSTGKIKVYVNGRYGKQQILWFYGKGDIVGFDGMFENGYAFSVAAIEDTEVCFFSKEDIRQMMDHYRPLTNTLLHKTSGDLVKAKIRERNLSHMSVVERIADCLLMLQDTFGTKPKGAVNITLSRQEIADYAGTTKEQVSKALSDFKKDGIIDLVVKEIIILDEPKLRAVSSASVASIW